MNKNVIFIRNSNIFDDSRATKEINLLLEMGFNVYVLGWARNTEAKRISEESFSQWKGRIFFKFYSIYLSNGIGMKNIDKLFGWFKWIYNEVKKINDIVFMHICNLDSAIGAYHFCEVKRIPYVYDIYDYYVDSHRIPFCLKIIVEYFETKIINRSATTIICTEERKQQIGKSSPKKLIIVHNSPEINTLYREEVESDYVYCGSLCEGRLIKEILDEYPQNTDLKFKFAGNDVYFEYVKQLSGEYENIEFLGSLRYSEVLKVEAKSRVISAIYEPSIRNHKLCAPNKFYEALALGKPLIVCRGTGIDKIVEKENIGFVINYDSKEFYQALRALKKDEILCREMGDRARELYEEKYRWSLMKEKLRQVYSVFE